MQDIYISEQPTYSSKQILQRLFGQALSSHVQRAQYGAKADVLDLSGEYDVIQILPLASC